MSTIRNDDATWISRRETATRLRCSASSVRRLLRQGLLSEFKSLHGKPLVNAADVAELVEQAHKPRRQAPIGALRPDQAAAALPSDPAAAPAAPAAPTPAAPVRDRKSKAPKGPEKRRVD